MNCAKAFRVLIHSQMTGQSQCILLVLDNCLSTDCMKADAPCDFGKAQGILSTRDAHKTCYFCVPARDHILIRQIKVSII